MLYFIKIQNFYQAQVLLFMIIPFSDPHFHGKIAQYIFFSYMTLECNLALRVRKSKKKCIPMIINFKLIKNSVWKIPQHYFFLKLCKVVTYIHKSKISKRNIIYNTEIWEAKKNLPCVYAIMYRLALSVGCRLASSC